MDIGKQNLEFLSQPLRLRRGTLIVSRVDRVTHYSKEFDWVVPDEWQKVFSAKAQCHLHERYWKHDPDLTGKTIYIDKFAGLEIVGTELLVITEDAVLAWEPQ